MVVWELLTNFAVDCLGLGSIRMVVSLMDDRNYFDLWVLRFWLFGLRLLSGNVGFLTNNRLLGVLLNQGLGEAYIEFKVRVVFIKVVCQAAI